ncbi:hypothetical protein [Streptomyces sp. V4I2]|uniref:hypothetical protein n=1 Tax=Streptomyces sp. V4I2 TaxID=3042280 RepID=UPI00277FD08A|nr:hypothetical protein [Streptomyces sp. V4I2]MDQ1051290.1 hypothetical protein [Streptomyces sp. V4I2]
MAERIMADTAYRLLPARRPLPRTAQPLPTASSEVADLTAGVGQAVKGGVCCRVCHDDPHVSPFRDAMTTAITSSHPTEACAKRKADNNRMRHADRDLAEQLDFAIRRLSGSALATIACDVVGVCRRRHHCLSSSSAVSVGRTALRDRQLRPHGRRAAHTAGCKS